MHYLSNDWIPWLSPRPLFLQLKAKSFDGADCVKMCVMFPLIKAGILSTGKAAESIFPVRNSVLVLAECLCLSCKPVGLGVALDGPSNVTSGLWSVTRMIE